MKTIYDYEEPPASTHRSMPATLVISVDANGNLIFDVESCCGPHSVAVPRHEYLQLREAVAAALPMVAVKRNPFGDPPPFDGSRVNPALGPDGPPPPDHVEVDTP